MPPVEKHHNKNRPWRSLDELAGSPRFREFLESEFPTQADPGGISRRRWLQVMGASLALAGVVGCGRQEEILPFAERPDGQTPGKSRRFATAMPRGDSAAPLLVTTVDGRPIKIEGNPLHPQSLGATDAFAQAAILGLYDPDRSRTVLRRTAENHEPSDWESFEETADDHFRRLRESGGVGFRVLAEADSSPTLGRLRREVLSAFPQAAWYEYEPTGDDNQRAGTQIAFGKPLRPQLSLADARVIVCLDDDLLGSNPAAVRLAREFAAGREGDPDSMNRLYVVESGYSITGAAADHRLALPSGQIAALAQLLEDRLSTDTNLWAGMGGSSGRDPVAPLVDAMADDLLANRGRSIVTVGSGQPPETHATVCRINRLLENVGATVTYTQVPNADRPSYVDAITTLVDEMQSGAVKTLLLLGGNPVYNAPADLDFGEAMKQVETTVHLSHYHDETSRQCAWSLPRAHFLEAWGDVRSSDGTYSIVQPMIEPLFGGRSSADVLTLVLGETNEPTSPEPPAEPTDAEPAQIVQPPTASQLAQRRVRQTFAQIDPQASWRRTLRDGFLNGSAWPVESLSSPGGPRLDKETPADTSTDDTLEVVFSADTCVHDGRFANNGWLQELPERMTRLTWDNAALVSPADAERLNVEHETLALLTVGDRPAVEIPVYIMPGQAVGSIGLSLGYGRTAAGRVGGNTSSENAAEPVGVDVYPLRTSGAMSMRPGVTLTPTGKPYPLACTQDHHALDPVGRKGQSERLGALVRESTLEHYVEHPDFAKHVVHHPPLESLWKDRPMEGHRWGMAIDLSKCVGCGVCVIACQAENNIPVVGKEQVALGREMHWIRVDRYFQGEVDDPTVVHQPVPCQQCELAPCEQVCPVAATTHTTEGLNDMVYNRCVGTRYCANNCPYKVRRFNYFNFHKELADDDVAKMKHNPQVSVRSRGVMEKCTYCVQRIQAAKIDARRPDGGESDVPLQTACQQACPAGAIVFGDLAEKDSSVLAAHDSPRAYSMLEELNIRPRTAYLARIRNPNPKLEPVDPQDEKHVHNIG